MKMLKGEAQANAYHFPKEGSKPLFASNSIFAWARAAFSLSLPICNIRQTMLIYLLYRAVVKITEIIKQS